MKGITLIEILIYTFLLSLIISLIIAILTNFFLGRGFFLTREKVSQSIGYLLEDLAREIHQTEKIIFPQENSFSSELQLKKENKEVVFKLENGIIIKKIEDKSFSLTPRNLNIRSLKFWYLKQSPNSPSSVKIRLEVEYENPLKLREYEFFTIYETSVTQRK